MTASSSEQGEGTNTAAGDRTTADAGEGAVEPAGPPPDWLIRIVNPVLKRLLRSPLHGVVSGSLLLLTVTGRRTGTEYTFPVGYERDGDIVTVFSHGTNWWKNLRGGGATVEVVLRGERYRGHAEVTEDDVAVARAVHDYLSRVGTRGARRVGLSVDGDRVPDVETLEGVVDHVVVVEIDLSES